MIAIAWLYVGIAKGITRIGNTIYEVEPLSVIDVFIIAVARWYL